MLVASCSCAKKKKGTKDWNKVVIDDIEQEWEEDDEPEELEHEYERIQRITKERQKKVGKLDFDINSPQGRAQ